MNIRRAAHRAILASVLSGIAGSSFAASNLIFHSSAAYGSGSANAIVVDAVGHVDVAGFQGSDFLTVQYNKTLKALTAQLDNGGLEIHGIAVDGSNNIIVVGDDNSGQHIMVVKYSAGTLQMLSSATLAVGAISDSAQAVTIDGSSNIVIAGYAQSGSFAALIAKFDSNLNLIQTTTYSDPNPSYAYGVATDASNNIVVAGQSQVSGLGQALILKYGPALGSPTATTLFAPISGGDYSGTGITLDSTGNIYFSGYVSPTNNGSDDVLIGKYSPDLSTLISSSTFDSGGDDYAWGIALDASANVYVAGQSQSQPALITQALVLKYDSNLVFVASGTFSAGVEDVANGIAVDGQSNVFLALNSGPSPGIFAVVRFNGAPQIATVSHGIQGVGSQNITVSGDNLVYASTIAFTGGMTGSITAAEGFSQLTAIVNIGTNVPIGVYGITLTNPDGTSVSNTAALEVDASTVVTGALGTNFTAMSSSGSVIFNILPGIFTQNFTLTISSPTMLPALGAFNALISGVFVRENIGYLASTFTLTMNYAASDIGGLDPTKFTLAFAPNAASPWVSLPSTLGNQAVTSTHAVSLNGFYAILQCTTGSCSSGASGGGSSGGGGDGLALSARKDVLVYPNPYKPGSNGAYGDPSEGPGLVFYNLDTTFRVQIYTVTGQLVKEIATTSTPDNTGTGKYFWDTTTNDGHKAASGVYLYKAYNGSGVLVRKGKFSIIR